jgi:DNA-binding NarL/FixJ family response regulator
MERMRSANARKEKDPLDALNDQEHKILALIAEGKTNKEIAAGLYLSTKTIEYHLANTYRKLNIHSRVELARIVSRDWGTTPSPDLVPARS